MIDSIIRLVTAATILVAVFFNPDAIVSQAIFWISIIVFGIPHGSIDHLVAQKGKIKPQIYFPVDFAIKYIGFILAMIVGWLIAPNLIFAGFIFLSAYHFGQSQLFNFTNNKKQSHWLHISYGTLIISTLFYFHINEVYEIIASFLTFEVIDQAIFYKIFFNLVIFSGFSTTFILIMLTIDKSISKRRLFLELLDLVLVVLLFRYTPLLISFGIYFGFWHSLRVMNTEIQVIRKDLENQYSIKAFIKALLPISIVSILGLGLLIAAGFIFQNQISPIMIFVIGISSLTLPHAVSMEFMYKKALA